MQNTKRLYSGFLEAAKLFPQNQALIIGDKSWSYSQIEDKAKSWAECLLSELQGRVSRVGIFAYKSECSYVAPLAAQFAGATFIPLNKSFPSARTKTMIEMAALEAIFVDKVSLPQFKEIATSLTQLRLVILPENLESEVASHLDSKIKIVDSKSLSQYAHLQNCIEVDENSAAYILFTSGSTGQPKGVPVSHKNLAHFFKLNQERYRITPDDILSQCFDQTFDLSMFDVYMAWNAGAAYASYQA